MKLLSIFLCMFSLVLSADEPFCSTPEKAAERVLEEIDTAYQDALKEGPKNEFTEYRDYMTMFLAHPLVIKEINKTLEYVLDIYDKYFQDIESACVAYPEYSISKEVLEYVIPFLETYNSNVVGRCFLILQFGLGELNNVEEQQQIQKLVVEYSVKTHMVATFYKEEEEYQNYLTDLLEQEKMKKIRTFCSESDDPFLEEVLLPEIEHVQTLRDYWDKYNFSMKILVDLEKGNHEPMNPLEEKLKEVVVSFSSKIQSLKEEYGSFIGF